MIYSTFTKVNRLIVLSFENEKDRTSFSKYYGPSIKIKDFNMLIDRKAFFDIPIENKEEAYEQVIEMSRNNNYTTGNLLDYAYFSKHYKLIELEDSDLKQQINFIGKLKKKKVQQYSLFLRKNKKPLLISHKIL